MALGVAGAAFGAPWVVCIGVDDAAGTRNAVRRAESDAVAVGSALKANGYKVRLLTSHDASPDAIRAALALKPALIYYAGHARDEQLLLRNGTVDVETLAQHTRVMILDCCYLGEALRNEGSAVVFAAGEGYAFEAGGNGLFTRSLLRWLRGGRKRYRMGLVDFVIDRVRHETGGWQKPVLGWL